MSVLDLTSVIAIGGMMVLRLAVPVLVLFLLSALLKRVLPSNGESI